MSLQSQTPLLERIGTGLLAAAPDSAWAKLNLVLTGAGGMLESGLEVVDDGGVANRMHEIDDDTLEACMELRDTMQQPGTGTWYNARLTVDRQGSLEVEFDYDNPPFDGDFEPELLINDQAEFPRDPEHLPDWHPSKRAG